jgi:polyhydroxybutyrate depolymerase
MKQVRRALAATGLLGWMGLSVFGCSSDAGVAGVGGAATGGGGQATGGITTFPSGGMVSSAGSMAAGGGGAGTAGAAGTVGAAGTFSGGAGSGAGMGGGAAGTGGSAAGSSGSGSGGGSAVTCPSTVLKAGDSNQTVKVGSLDRTYTLHTPTGYTGDKPLPLVIDFHPLGISGSSWEGQSGWKAKADSTGFIVAYPNSYNSNNSWNVGMCCQDAQKNQIDDVAFAKALIQQVESLACVDPKRVYATGCSNGGGMTYKVACDLADMIAGAAPVDFRCVYGGSTNSPSCDMCKPSRPVSVTHFDNTGDTMLVPYAGGTTSFAADCPPNSSCVGMAFPSAQDNFKAWQSIAGCSGSTLELSGNSACQTNTMCMGGAQVSMCVQQGGSHCGNYGTLKIVDTAWDMFQKEALP